MSACAIGVVGGNVYGYESGSLRQLHDLNVKEIIAPQGADIERIVAIRQSPEVRTAMPVSFDALNCPHPGQIPGPLVLVKRQ